MAAPAPTAPVRDAEQPGDPIQAMTPAQWAAVMADERVVCVLAGAGTGKTRVLTMRVARRCADGTTTPGHTLVCTFSRKAADELRNRLRHVGVVGVSAGTIHRSALRILREWRDHVGAPPPRVLGDRRRILETVVSGDHSAPTMTQHLDTEVGWAKAQMVGAQDYEAFARGSERLVRMPLSFVAESFTAYELERRRRGLLDLDDLILEAGHVLEQDEGFAETLRWRFRHLYVDEVQDVNAAQYRLLRLLWGTDPDLFVVGDPNQSIYGWNGADPELLRRLPEELPGTRVIRLGDNHRSSPAIVRLATAALEANEAPRSTQPDGPVPVIVSHESDADEAQWVASEAWRSHRPGRRWSSVAVLARTNAQLRTVAQALDRQKVPFTFASGDLGPASDLGAPLEDGTLREVDVAEAKDGEQSDGVVLSTFHRAKGLQWPFVFVIGLVEGLVPLRSARSAPALDEERRLLYVAMTRAEEELWCSWARMSRPEARTKERNPCRWLGLIEQEQAELRAEQAPASSDSVASHIARLRSIVADRNKDPVKSDRPARP